MKLVNQSLKYLTISILLIVTFWSVLFYINLLDEIHDSIDDGLDNYKLLIIKEAQTDSTVLHKLHFDEGNYAITKLNKPNAMQVKDVYKDTLMYMLNENDLEPVRILTTAFEQKGNYYKLKVLSPMAEEDDMIEDLFWAVFWLYIILVVSIVLINNFILRKLWKPFYTLLHQLTNFKLGSNKGIQNVTTNTKEFNHLQTVINQLLAHSVTTYENQKQFIGNASHELQTPLAIINNKLELLLENGTLNNTDAASVAEILQISERLVSLNKALLLLTKIESKQLFNNVPVNLGNLTHTIVEELEDFATYKQIEVNVHQTNALMVTIDATLAQIVLRNLIKNAIVHTANTGKVLIHITNNSITISNTGNHTLDANQLFNRFYKPENTTTGTGLGLAIVKAICNLYGFGVGYHFYNNEHFFTLTFKTN